MNLGALAQLARAPLARKGGGGSRFKSSVPHNQRIAQLAERHLGNMMEVPWFESRCADQPVGSSMEEQRVSNPPDECRGPSHGRGRWFDSIPTDHFWVRSSIGRASVSKTLGCGFESRRTRHSNSMENSKNAV